MGKMNELKDLIESQARDLKREKYNPRQYPEIIQHRKEKTTFTLDQVMIYSAHLAGFSQKEIASKFAYHQSTISRYISRVKRNIHT